MAYIPKKGSETSKPTTSSQESGLGSCRDKLSPQTVGEKSNGIAVEAGADNNTDKKLDFSQDRGTIVMRPSDSSVSKKEQDLWQKVERIMAAKRIHVQQVLEEFGVADVSPPPSRQLEEQVWRVVQGELTLHEAADLV